MFNIFKNKDINKTKVKLSGRLKGMRIRPYAYILENKLPEYLDIDVFDEKYKYDSEYDNPEHSYSYHNMPGYREDLDKIKLLRKKYENTYLDKRFEFFRDFIMFNYSNPKAREVQLIYSTDNHENPKKISFYDFMGDGFWHYYDNVAVKLQIIAEEIAFPLFEELDKTQTGQAKIYLYNKIAELNARQLVERNLRFKDAVDWYIKAHLDEIDNYEEVFSVNAILEIARILRECCIVDEKKELATFSNGKITFINRLSFARPIYAEQIEKLLNELLAHKKDSVDDKKAIRDIVKDPELLKAFTIAKNMHPYFKETRYEKICSYNCATVDEIFQFCKEKYVRCNFRPSIEAATYARMLEFEKLRLNFKYNNYNGYNGYGAYPKPDENSWRKKHKEIKEVKDERGMRYVPYHKSLIL